MESGTFWYDRGLHLVLSSLDVTEHDYQENSETGLELSVTVLFDSVHTTPVIEDIAEYLEITTNTDTPVEDAVARLVTEVETALDIEYNTVGDSPAVAGQYEKINDRQWKKVEDESIYDEYSDLLYAITGRDVDFNDAHPSIPGLYRPFLQAVAESDTHEIPPQSAVKPILEEHINALRQENSSRKAVSTLKRELEREGINARTAARVANQMDGLLLPDSEIQSTE